MEMEIMNLAIFGIIFFSLFMLALGFASMDDEPEKRPENNDRE